MKKLLFLCWGAMISLQSFSQCVINYDKWEQIVYEEFVSQASFQNNWDPDFDPNKCPDGVDYSQFVPQNAFIQNGVLKLTSTILPAPVSKCGHQVGYNAGWVAYKNQKFKYGLFEARCKMPAGAGFESAFWLFAYPGDEIDIFEYGDDSKEFSTSLVDWYYPSQNNPRQVCSQYWNNRHCKRLSEEFHLYSLAWGPDYVTFFFDGKEVWTKNPSAFFVENCPDNTADCAMQFILSTGANNWALAAGATFEVDYVKIYQEKMMRGSYKKDAYPVLNLPTTVYSKIHSQEKSLAVGENYGIVYRDINNWINGIYPDQTGWHTNYLTRTWNAQELAGGDVSVVTEEFKDQIYYRGADGYLHAYLYENNDWVHHIIEDPAVPYSSNPNVKISAQPGSLAAGKCNEVYYRGTDDFVHRFAWIGWKWEHSYVSNPANINEKVAGDLVIGEYNLTFYRGTDNKIHHYYYSNGWNHTIVGTYPTSNNYVFAQTGSLVVGDKDQLFYIGSNGRLQTFMNVAPLYQPVVWQHSYLSSTYIAAANAFRNLTIHRGSQLFYVGANDAVLRYHLNPATDLWEYSNTGLTVKNNLVADPNNFLYYNGFDDYVHNWAWRGCGNMDDLCMIRTPLNKTTGLDNMTTAKKERVSLFPNPNNGHFTMAIDELHSPSDVVIMDIMGKMVFQQRANATSMEIDIESLPNGMYFLCYSEADTVTKIKFVKQ